MEYSHNDVLSIITCMTRKIKLFDKTSEESIITGNNVSACTGTTNAMELLISVL